jgi:hypothetical protein
MMQQPEWVVVAQLGDVNPLDHGGYWVLVDSTGAYAPEGEWVEVEDDDRLTVYRFLLEKCSFVNGVLSDNKYHVDHPAWFADDLESVAAYCGASVGELRDCFCSDDPVVRARAYQDVGSYHGFENLDSYPLVLGRAEGVVRYESGKYVVK